jgi:hypothetical protein
MEAPRVAGEMVCPHTNTTYSMETGCVAMHMLWYIFDLSFVSTEIIRTTNHLVIRKQSLIVKILHHAC